MTMIEADTVIDCIKKKIAECEYFLDTPWRDDVSILQGINLWDSTHGKLTAYQDVLDCIEELLSKEKHINDND